MNSIFFTIWCRNEPCLPADRQAQALEYERKKLYYGKPVA